MEAKRVCLEAAAPVFKWRLYTQEHANSVMRCEPGEGTLEEMREALRAKAFARFCSMAGGQFPYNHRMLTGVCFSVHFDGRELVETDFRSVSDYAQLARAWFRDAPPTLSSNLNRFLPAGVHCYHVTCCRKYWWLADGAVGGIQTNQYGQAWATVDGQDAGPRRAEVVESWPCLELADIALVRVPDGSTGLELPAVVRPPARVRVFYGFGRRELAAGPELNEFLKSWPKTGLALSR